MFRSNYFACTGGLSTETAQNSVTVTNAEQEALVDAGTNNVKAGTAANALTSGYLPGTGAAGVTAYNAALLNPAGTSFLVTTSYIGAISGPSDTWYQGWTCNSNRANFGAAGSACTTVPVT
ncbi:hypothetical protein [Sphingomonas sp. J315]|uniref:hypothetical protein n=1 Tax=Sphingomonas sp. J315 TaxID=2898433 RepID=UPI00289813DF|nr:hypothetical protein [Sphingomonas sp. J315]